MNLKRAKELTQTLIERAVRTREERGPSKRGYLIPMYDYHIDALDIILQYVPDSEDTDPNTRNITTNRRIKRLIRKLQEALEDPHPEMHEDHAKTRYAQMESREARR